MGILSALLGSTGGGLIKNVSDAVDKFIETPDEKAANELKKMAMNMERELRQIDVNKEEAKHASIFVAGWRPSVGWICAIALGYHYIIQPFLVFGMRIVDPVFIEPPTLDLGELMPVLLGMLGLGAMRSFEKTKGVHRDNLKAEENGG